MRESSEKIRSTVQQRFTETALSPNQEKTFPVGPDSAKAFGYDAGEIDSLPSSVTASFCGVGNPLALAVLQLGQTVLDLGSGAGLDSILAARRVGPNGRVVGVDMTEAMFAKAKSNAETLGSVRRNSKSTLHVLNYVRLRWYNANHEERAFDDSHCQWRRFPG